MKVITWGIVLVVAASGGVAGQAPDGAVERSTIATASATVADTGNASRPAAAAEAAPRLVLKGFIGASVFFQDAAFGFGNGQNALWVKAQPQVSDAEILGGDVRNSRVTVSISGNPVASGMRGGAVLELDFFGGYNGSSATSDEQPLPRLRLAYADLSQGRTTLRVGQFWSPLLGYLPVSPTHVAFPLGLGSAGVIGWRHPGVLLQRTIPTATGKPTITLQFAAQRGSWNGPGDVLDQQSAGETSRVPQLEARIDVAQGARWSVFAVGHYDRKDLSGFGPDTTAAGSLSGRAIAAGAKGTFHRLTVQGNAYRAHAIGQQLGQLSQYGDIHSHGGWLQLGYAVTRTFSLWGYAGEEDPNDADVRRAVTGDARLHNRLGALTLQYTSGDYTAGLEWMHASTRWGRSGSDDSRRRSGNQLSFSVVYRFTSETATTAAVAAK